MKTLLRIATRKSPLALWQANFVKEALLKKHPNLSVELIGVVTEGDQKQEISLASVGGKGLFVKALQQKLLNNEADIAVHSIKDMSVHPVKNLILSAILKRADARDVLISNQYSSIAALPSQAIVGTASPRRSAILKSLRPDIQIQLLRGNVDTRLSKLDAGKYDAIILAAAGVERLGLGNRIREYLPEAIFTPAIGQGAIGIESRENDEKTRELVSFLHDAETGLCVMAERAVNQILNGDCHTPIGAHAKIISGQMHLSACYEKNSEKLFRAEMTGDKNEAAQLGKKMGLELKKLIDDRP